MSAARAEHEGRGLSRWNARYKEHGFFTHWGALKIELTSLEVADATSEQRILELARLHKATAFIDTVLNEIDPELVPPVFLDPLIQIAEACLGQVRAFKGNQNHGHLVKANNQVDSMLTTVLPYASLASEAPTTEAAMQYGKTLSDFVSQFIESGNKVFESIKLVEARATAISGTLESHLKRAETLSHTLFDDNDGVEIRIQRALAESQTKQREAAVIHADVTSLAAQVKSAEAAASANSETIKTQLVNSASRLDQVNEFHARVFGASDGSSVGLKSELDERLKQLGALESEQKIKHAALVDEIEALLPGATSAGLASSFATLKNEFQRSVTRYAIVFYVCLSALALGSLLVVSRSVSLFPPAIAFVDPSSWDELGRTLLLKLPIVLPIVWLALFSATRRSQYERLQQEYAHKESLAASYESYKRQLAALKVDVESLQRELIAKTIESVAYNASKTLDGNHAEKLPAMQILEKFSLDEMKKLKDLVKS